MLIEMELREILYGPSIVPTIVLKEKEGGRDLSFQIGDAEVIALDNAIHRIRMLRPFTHDLILNVIDGMGGLLKRVVIDDSTVDYENKKGLTFHGKLDIELADQSRVWIDSRPSDAIILATKMSLPIYIEEKVLDQTLGE